MENPQHPLNVIIDAVAEHLKSLGFNVGHSYTGFNSTPPLTYNSISIKRAPSDAQPIFEVLIGRSAFNPADSGEDIVCILRELNEIQILDAGSPGFLDTIGCLAMRANC